MAIAEQSMRAAATRLNWVKNDTWAPRVLPSIDATINPFVAESIITGGFAVCSDVLLGITQVIAPCLLGCEPAAWFAAASAWSSVASRIFCSHYSGSISAILAVHGRYQGRGFAKSLRPKHKQGAVCLGVSKR